MGIFQRLYTLFETACHELDVKLAGTAASTPEDAKETYIRYCKQLQEVRADEERITATLSAAESFQEVALQVALNGDSNDARTVSLLTYLQSEAQKLHQVANSLVSGCAFPPFDVLFVIFYSQYNII